MSPRPKPEGAIRVDRTIAGFVYRVNLRPSPRGYQGDVYLRSGRRVRFGTGTDDLDEARAVVEALDIRALEPAHAPEPEGHNPTIAEMREFYASTWMRNQNRKARTIAGALSNIGEFETWCRTRNIGRCSQVSTKVIEDFKAELLARGNAAKTIALKVGDLRAMWNACEAVDMIPEGTIKRWILPKTDQSEIRSMEPRELSKLLAMVAKSEPRYSPCIHWIAYTGNRPSDARDLRWEQIDLATRTVRRVQCKTRSLAEYQISDEALEVLQRVKGREGLVFALDGKPMGRNDLLRALNRATAGTPLEWVNIKTLRHTFGYAMANLAGCPLPVLQRLMGHSDIRMTMRYVRATDAQPALAQFGKLLKT